MQAHEPGLFRPVSRYSRQFPLPDFGEHGQRRLRDSCVFVAGCGALGSTQAELLVRSGVGRVILADRDIVEIHNLPRQQLFCEKDASDELPKAVAAARRLTQIDSSVVVEPHVVDINSYNIAPLTTSATVIMDGTDNFSTRFLINDLCVMSGKTWIYGGVVRYEGTVMPVVPGVGPCFRCLCRDLPSGEAAWTCDRAGVLNTAVVWVAALQVTHALKALLGVAHDAGTLTSLDIWGGGVRQMKVARDPDCPCCGHSKYEWLSRSDSSVTVLCGRNAVQLDLSDKWRPDFEAIQGSIGPEASVNTAGAVLEARTEECRFLVFRDGRVIVFGTTDPICARQLVNKHLPFIHGNGVG